MPVPLSFDRQPVLPRLLIFCVGGDVHIAPLGFYGPFFPYCKTRRRFCGKKRTEFSPFLLSPHPAAFGNADGEQDFVLRVLAAAGGIYSCQAHERQGSIQTIEKQTHILEDEGGPSAGRRCLDLPQQRLYVLLRLGHVHMPLDDGLGRGDLLLLVGQAQQRPGVALG